MNTSQWPKYSFQRPWSRLRAMLPSQTADERRAIYEGMHGSATASVDFYTLILLSSLIAYFGRVQDSGVVNSRSRKSRSGSGRPMQTRSFGQRPYGKSSEVRHP